VGAGNGVTHVTWAYSWLTGRLGGLGTERKYGTRTHDNVVAWLDKHPRFHLHFIPTSSSWLNMVERWFRELTEKAIRRGVFKSVPDLIAAIEAYLQANNSDPGPFVWTATAEEILEKVSRGRVALASIPANNETQH
jgi:hypothetical protein